MRGYAILAIFLIHSGGGGLREWSEFTKSIVVYGKYGVDVFLLISAFTITMSVDLNKKFIYRKYLLRRYLRIAPLYYFMLLTGFFLGGQLYYQNMFDVESGTKDLLLHFTFLNVFDSRYQNTLIGVEWCLPIIFFYYIILPYVFFFSRISVKRKLLVFFTSFVISASPIIIKFLGFEYYRYSISYNWSLEKYAFIYGLGVLLYQACRPRIMNTLPAMEYVTWSKMKVNSIMLFMLGSFLLFIYIDPPEYYFLHNFFFVLWTVSFIYIYISHLSRDSMVRILFENGPILFLGKISFSFYLVHYMVLRFVSQFSPGQKFIYGLTIAIVTSVLLYYFIEKPSERMGKLFYRGHDFTKIQRAD